MKHILATLMLSFLFCIPVPAQTETKCDLSAFATDSTSGVNIRAGAGRDFRIIKTVPKDERGTMFDVVGAKGEWLKVVYAVNSGNEAIFSGSGWVLAALLSIKTGGIEALKARRPTVYQSPNKSGGQIPFSDFGIGLPLRGCQESWVKVQLPAKGTATAARIFGWLPRGAYCGNPWIECD